MKDTVAEMLEQIYVVEYIVKGHTQRLVDDKYRNKSFTFKDQCFCVKFLPAIHSVEYHFYIKYFAFIEGVQTIEIINIVDGTREKFKF